MEISSSAFKDGEKIPIQYVMPGAGGKNISIPLAWKNVPPGDKIVCSVDRRPTPGRPELGPLAGHQHSKGCDLHRRREHPERKCPLAR